MSKPLIWTSIAAVIVSSFSLAASGWVIANDRGNPTAPVEPAVAVAVPLAVPAKAEPAAAPAPAPAPAPEKGATANHAKPEKPVVATSVASHADASDLSIKRFIVAAGVENREPVGASDSFIAGDARVYAFVEMANRSASDGEVVIAFERGSTRAGMVELEIPAKCGRWRTWGYTRGLRQAGSWDVVVRDEASGKELARKTIEVKAAASPAPTTAPTASVGTL